MYEGHGELHKLRLAAAAWMRKAGSDETLLLPSRKEQETGAC
jgi:hypothetical protein